MKISGSLLKMKSEISQPIKYYLPIGSESVEMNSLINKPVRFTFENQIFCTNCGSKTYKSFNQGLCYPCFQSSPLASECIIHPEKCQAHLGIGRDMEWEKKYHLTPQIVYLALTANAKVGITRKPQIPTRWIDQGAVQTVILAETPNRYLAGVIEVTLKDFIGDKTHWQKMLKNEIYSILLNHKDHKIEEIYNNEKIAIYDVIILGSDNFYYEFKWQVERYNGKGSLNNCWLTTAVSNPVSLGASI